MNKILLVVALVLALNFVAAAGGVGLLVAQHKIDREKLAAIKEIVFPKPVPVAPATEPSYPIKPTSQPIDRLETLLAGASGRPASEQVEFIQHSFDSQTAILDRRQRELGDLQLQVELSKQQLDKDRQALDAKMKSFTAQQQAANQLATDKGFQDSLELYKVMPARQVKTIFMGLNDDIVLNYLQAMEPKMASKIIKEFKAPDETERVQKILERMRLAQASAKGT